METRAFRRARGLSGHSTGGGTGRDGCRKDIEEIQLKLPQIWQTRKFIYSQSLEKLHRTSSKEAMTRSISIKHLETKGRKLGEVAREQAWAA